MTRARHGMAALWRLVPRPTALALLALALILIALSVIANVSGCDRPSQAPLSTQNQAGTQAGRTVTPLLKSRLVRTVDSGVREARGLAVDAAGRVYVAGQGGVVIFDRQWSKVAAIAMTGAATAIAVDEAGRVFVAERQKVHAFDREGQATASWGEPGKGPGQMALVTGLAVAGENVYVADPGNRVIHRYDTTGDFIDDIGRTESGAREPGIICPSPYLDCATDGAGRLFVGNPGKWRVEQYDHEGRVVAFWGKSGMADDRYCGCCNPTNLVVMADGNFLVAEKGQTRVKIMDRQDRLVALMGGENFADHSAGIDLAVDLEGRVLALDPATGKVLVFEIEKPAAE